VGREGISGDVGGHIQACRHGGTCDRFNLFPQNATFNNSTYRAWENQITRALQNGDDVGNVTVRLIRANPYTARPDSLEIEYRINGVNRRVEFENLAGG
jgi:filamentous hemagglutinin